MKKLFLLALLAATSTTAALAQARAGGETTSKDYTGGAVTDSRNTGFGVKGGLNRSELRGDDKDKIPGRDNLNTYHAGVYGQFGFNEFASVQVELLYSRKGFESDGSTGSTTARRLDYLALPILFVGNVTETLSFHIGPQVSVLTKVRENGQDIAIASNGYHSLDYGGVVGAEARLGPARIGLRYDLGLGKIYDDSRPAVGGVQIGNANIYNQTLQAYVGIGFRQ